MDVSSGGIAFALKYATLEGKITIAVLLLFSLVSWTVIINKFRQLARARKRTRKFLTVYSKAKGPLYIYNRGPLKVLAGAPMYDVYMGGCEELDAQLKRYGQKIPNYAMSAVRIAIERALGEAAVSLESGMIVLATAISGGPFVGLLGTVWGVMDTFSGIGRVQQASLTAMAPGVAAALIATVAGLMVAIPSLFCYNYLVTRIRTLTMEMDNFAAHLETVFVSEYLQLSRNGSGPEDPAQQFLTKPKEEAEPTMGAAAGH
jgi:biopolymer transport protein ExbB/TolQ